MSFRHLYTNLLQPEEKDRSLLLMCWAVHPHCINAWLIFSLLYMCKLRERDLNLFFLSFLILNLIYWSYIFIPLPCPNIGPSMIDIIQSLWSCSRKMKPFKSEQKTFILSDSPANTPDKLVFTWLSLFRPCYLFPGHVQVFMSSGSTQSATWQGKLYCKLYIGIKFLQVVVITE